MMQLFKVFTVLLLLLSSLNAATTGTASIFSFLEGVALEGNEVLVDGKEKFYTDDDGSVEVVLEVGKHQIEVFAKDVNGHNIGYAKKVLK